MNATSESFVLVMLLNPILPLVSRIVSQLLKLIRQAALGENPLNIVRLRSNVGRLMCDGPRIVF